MKAERAFLICLVLDFSVSRSYRDSNVAVL